VVPVLPQGQALLRAKAIAYDEVDVTADEARQNEMVERSGMRSVPQIFLDGEQVGGYDDLAHLNATGELDRRLGRGEGAPLRDVYDVAVVGAGPAGLTAAMYAARKNLSTLVIAMDIGGQVGLTAEVANYPGFDLVAGPDLADRYHEQAAKYEIAELIGERVVGLSLDGRCKVLDLESGRSVRASTVIIATGVQKRRLDVPGERKLTGRGVVYCSTCDGPLFKGLTIAVVGAGNSGSRRRSRWTTWPPRSTWCRTRAGPATPSCRTRSRRLVTSSRCATTSRRDPRRRRGRGHDGARRALGEDPAA